MQERKRIYRLIDNSPLCEERNQIGYCWCDTHPGFLSERLLKEHECLRKQCSFLERFENKPYWQYRLQQKKRKEKLKQKRQKKDSILHRFKELTSGFENFAVCDIECKDGIYFIRCVSTQAIELKNIQSVLSQEFKTHIKTYFVQNTYTARQNLINIIKEKEKKEKLL